MLLHLMFLLCTVCAGSETVHSVYTCEEPLRLECTEGSVVSIVRANYGRYSISVCNPRGFTNISTQCTAYTTLHTIQNICSNLRSCSVEPSVLLFGDSCPGTPKYLEVQYSCLRRVEPEEREEPRFWDEKIRELWEQRDRFLSEETVRTSLSLEQREPAASSSSHSSSGSSAGNSINSISHNSSSLSHSSNSSSIDNINNISSNNSDSSNHNSSISSNHNSSISSSSDIHHSIPSAESDEPLGSLLNLDGSPLQSPDGSPLQPPDGSQLQPPDGGSAPSVNNSSHVHCSGEPCDQADAALYQETEEEKEEVHTSAETGGSTPLSEPGGSSSIQLVEPREGLKAKKKVVIIVIVSASAILCCVIIIFCYLKKVGRPRWNCFRTAPSEGRTCFGSTHSEARTASTSSSNLSLPSPTNIKTNLYSSSSHGSPEHPSLYCSVSNGNSSPEHPQVYCGSSNSSIVHPGVYCSSINPSAVHPALYCSSANNYHLQSNMYFRPNMCPAVQGSTATSPVVHSSTNKNSIVHSTMYLSSVQSTAGEQDLHLNTFHPTEERSNNNFYSDYPDSVLQYPASTRFYPAVYRSVPNSPTMFPDGQLGRVQSHYLDRSVHRPQYLSQDELADIHVRRVDHPSVDLHPQGPQGLHNRTSSVHSDLQGLHQRTSSTPSDQTSAENYGGRESVVPPRYLASPPPPQPHYPYILRQKDHQQQLHEIYYEKSHQQLQHPNIPYQQHPEIYFPQQPHPLLSLRQQHNSGVSYQQQQYPELPCNPPQHPQQIPNEFTLRMYDQGEPALEFSTREYTEDNRFAREGLRVSENTSPRVLEQKHSASSNYF